LRSCISPVHGTLAVWMVLVAASAAEPSVFLGLLLAGPVLILVASEPERSTSEPDRRADGHDGRRGLGNRTRTDSGRRPGALAIAGALLRAPLVSGGGRGALLIVLLLACVPLGQLVVRWLMVAAGELEPDRPVFGHDDPVQLTLIATNALVFVLLPSGLGSPWLDRALVRWGARLASLGMAIPSLTAFAGASGGDVRDRPVWDAFSLLHAMGHDGEFREFARAKLWVLGLVAALSIGLHLPRMMRGVRMVVEATPGRG